MKTIDIRKILVPMDFSRSSVKALRLAIEMAVTHDASIQLLHVTDNDYDLYSSDIQQEPSHFTETVNRLGVFAESVIDQHNIKCFYTSQYGSVTHCILASAKNIHADLIIMGKNGRNGRTSAYAGTHCCQVAEKSWIPVIIVPEELEKFSIENILFPVRPLLSMMDKYNAIRCLLTNKAAIAIVNLRDPKNEIELHIIHQLSQQLKVRLEEDMVPYTMEYYFKDDSFGEKVLDIIGQKKFDLVILSSEEDESQLDFHISQYVQKIIHNTSIPALILHAAYPKMIATQILNKLETLDIEHKN